MSTGPDNGPVVAKPKRNGHLYQIDLVRLVTFARSSSTTSSRPHVGHRRVAGVGLPVPLHTQCSSRSPASCRPTSTATANCPVDYWQRRYKLIGLPFLVWSLFCWGYTRYRRGGIDTALTDIFNSWHSIGIALRHRHHDLITGHAFYHMYFMSVSMQIYLVFLWQSLWVLKRTWGYHRFYLLAISFAFHAWLIWRMMLPPLEFFASGLPGTLWSHLTITLLPYQFFILSGAVAAMHLGVPGVHDPLASPAHLRRSRRRRCTLWWYTAAYHGGPAMS